MINTLNRYTERECALWQKREIDLYLIPKLKYNIVKAIYYKYVSINKNIP